MAARSVAYGAAIAAGSVVNQPATFFLQTRDEHGNDCNAAAAAARCVLRRPPPRTLRAVSQHIQSSSHTPRQLHPAAPSPLTGASFFVRA